MANPALKPKAQQIIDACPPHLRSQLADLLEYLPGIVQNGHVPEGSVAALFNKQPPEIRAILNAIGEAADTPRDRPFVPKETRAERFDSFGLDAFTCVPIADAMDGQYVMESLQDRMGTDAQQPDEPLTTRDILSAAYDAHSTPQGA